MKTRSNSIRIRSTRSRLGWRPLCVLAVTLASCAHPNRLPTTTEPLGRQAACIPRFPDAGGWLGGDAAYSVALADRDPDASRRASVWLFGDSFVDRAGAEGRRSYPFVHNSVGVSECGEEDGAWSLTFGWGGRDDWSSHGEAPPAAFFVPDPQAEWVKRATSGGDAPPYYWPLDGFVLEDTLFVALLRVLHAEPRGPFNLPFRPGGVDLARIENPRDPPEHWRIALSTLSDDPRALPGSAFVIDADYLFAFTFLDLDDGRSPRVLTRLALDPLRQGAPDLASRLETLTAEGRWEAGLHPDRARRLMDDDATEMSVHFDPRVERWLAVYASPTPPSRRTTPDTIRLRSARSLAGPWSAPLALYAIPETKPDADGRLDPNLFCYAAKAHPQFAPAGRLLVSYVCNLFARSDAEVGAVLERLAGSPWLYRPKTVSLPVPAAARGIGGSFSLGH